MDLEIGSDASPLTSYVAITRVRSRADILVLRPFAREIFTRGSPEGPELLLELLQGEDVDLADIRARHQQKQGQRNRPRRESTRCSQCGKSSPEATFNTRQYKEPVNTRKCNDCVQDRRGKPVGHCSQVTVCAVCGKSPPEVDFNNSQKKQPHTTQVQYLRQGTWKT